MRLIDADALLENQPKDCCRTSDWINAAPTIDAIPVEWLEEKRDSQNDPWDYLANAIDYILAVYKEEQEAR